MTASFCMGPRTWSRCSHRLLVIINLRTKCFGQLNNKEPFYLSGTTPRVVYCSWLHTSRFGVRFTKYCSKTPTIVRYYLSTGEILYSTLHAGNDQLDDLLRVRYDVVLPCMSIDWWMSSWQRYVRKVWRTACNFIRKKRWLLAVTRPNRVLASWYHRRRFGFVPAGRQVSSTLCCNFGYLRNNW